MSTRSRFPGRIRRRAGCREKARCGECRLRKLEAARGLFAHVDGLVGPIRAHRGTGHVYQGQIVAQRADGAEQPERADF